MAAVAEVKKKERVLPVFTPAKQQEHSHAAMAWYFEAPDGLVPTDLENPDCWSPVCGGPKSLRAGDHCHVTGGGWYAWVLMVDVLGARCVPVVLLQKPLRKMLDAELGSLPAGTELFRHENRWGVRFVADSKELIPAVHFEAKEAARQAVDHAIFRNPQGS